MVKRFLICVAFTAPLFSVSHSTAATFDLGQVSGFAPIPYRSGISNNFIDYYNFSIGGQSSYNASVITFQISGPTLALYAGTYTGSGTPTSSPIAAATFSGSTAASLGTFGGDLGGGSYYFQVAGDGVNSANDGYNGAISVSAVPLPPALPMFGAALVGLVGFGMFRNRRRSSDIAVV